MPDNPDIGAPAPAWNRLRFEARAAAADEPALASYLNSAILAHSTLCQALSFHLAEKLKSPVMSTQQVRQILSDTYDSNHALVEAAEDDLPAAACCSLSCTSRVSLPFRPIALLIRSGVKGVKRCPSISRAALRNCLAWTSTQLPA